MAGTTHAGTLARRAHWLRRPATVLVGLMLTGAGVLVVPSMAGAATKATTGPDPISEQAIELVINDVYGVAADAINYLVPEVELFLATLPGEAGPGFSCIVDVVDFLVDGGPPPGNGNGCP